MKKLIVVFAILSSAASAPAHAEDGDGVCTAKKGQEAKTDFCTDMDEENCAVNEAVCDWGVAQAKVKTPKASSKAEKSGATKATKTPKGG